MLPPRTTVPPEQPHRATLADESTVLIRSVQPDDKQLLAQGFAGLSETSRYRRFFTSKQELTEHELRYLTEVDGWDHLALGALRVRVDGSLEPVGVARYVRLAPEADVAEAAVAVVDAMQGKGLGKLLLEQLGRAAVSRGVTRFRCTVLAENTAMQALLHDLDPSATVVSRAAGSAEIELHLPQAEPRPEDEARSKALQRVLAHAAREPASVRVGPLRGESCAVGACMESRPTHES